MIIWDYLDLTIVWIIWCHTREPLLSSPSALDWCHFQSRLIRCNSPGEKISKLVLVLICWIGCWMIDLCVGGGWVPVGSCICVCVCICVCNNLLSAWLPVYRTLVQFWVLPACCVDCIDVDDGHLLVQNLERADVMQLQQKVHFYQRQSMEWAFQTVTLARLSTSLPIFLSRLAPSRNSPWYSSE